MPRIHDPYEWERIVLYERIPMKRLERETGIEYRTLQNYKKKPWTAKWKAVAAIITVLWRDNMITQAELINLITRR